MDLKKMHEKPPYGMIAIMFIGAFVALLNNTLLNIALPAIMEEFSIKPSRVQWLTTGYMLVNGILIPASAFYSKIYKPKIIYNSDDIVLVWNTFSDICTNVWCTYRSRMIRYGIGNDDAVTDERYVNCISN